MFDIDLNEIVKFESLNVKIDLGVCLDIDSKYFENFLTIFQTNHSNYSSWQNRIAQIRATLPSEPRNFSGPGVNPYEFIKILSEKSAKNLNLVLDTGCTVAWTMQAWKLKSGQKVFHDFNNTAMGWSIPAAVASTIAEPNRKTFCLVGDGSVMMSLGDLATLRSYSKDTKVFLLNNGGYSMIKQTQDQWFDSDYFASDAKSDLSFPNFESIANAFGFNYVRISDTEDLNEKLEETLQSDAPCFCEVMIQEDARVVPIVKFGSPNYVMDPEL
jgi:acetolactate synthase-1/2/3 large subunit